MNNGTFDDYDECMSQFLDKNTDPIPTEGYLFQKCKLHYCEDEGGIWRPLSIQMCLPPLDYVWGMVSGFFYFLILNSIDTLLSYV